MVTLRAFDSAVASLQTEGEWRGSRGGEALIAGVATALGSGDALVAACHQTGLALACGIEAEEVAANLFAAEPQHDRALQRTGSERTAGGTRRVPLESLAEGVRMHGLGDAQLTGARALVCVVRDDAVDGEDFLEALGIAIEERLPVVFVCENNQHAVPSATRSLYEQARTFDLPSDEVDGMNALAVVSRLARVLDELPSADGPVLLEALTFYPGPAAPAGSGRDALEALRQALVSEARLSLRELAEIHRRADTEVARAVAEVLARTSPGQRVSLPAVPTRPCLLRPATPTRPAR
jgi:pyruvate dehydrogenase E1 component alpha subunit